jgi:hypothetical protein
MNGWMVLQPTNGLGPLIGLQCVPDKDREEPRASRSPRNSGNDD